MTGLRKVILVLAALCLMAGATAGGAVAKPQDGKAAKKPKQTAARLDPGFGHRGVARTATSRPEAKVRMALAPGGRVYVLQAPLLLAFEADGKPARSFGNGGRVRIEDAPESPTLENLTVDSQGRVLVVGTTSPGGSESPTKPVPPSEAYIGSTASLKDAVVIRILEDGSRDPSFGSGGEVATTFGLPRPTGAPGKGVEYPTPIVTGSTITVDSQDRPVVGGSYFKEVYFCGYRNFVDAAYTARLNAAGALDTSYGAGAGYTITGANGTVKAMAGTPEGGVATVSSGSTCGAKEFEEPATFDSIAEAGGPSPALDPARPSTYLLPTIAVDSQGRSLLIQTENPFRGDPLVLARLLPSGDYDSSFGFGGGIPLAAGLTDSSVLAVDGRNRTLVAAGRGAPEIVRYTKAGKRDGRFGRKGVLKGGGAGDADGQVTALAVDSKGRIYTAGSIKNGSLKSGVGIQVTRFLPGR